MEENRENQHTENESPAQHPEGYVPRPVWQVWAARIGLVVFILFVIFQIVNLARGGL